MRTIRGAITAENTKSDITEKTQSLISEIMKVNSLCVSDVEAIIFSSTVDLTEAYPATAARLMGFTKASLFSSLEPPVKDSLKGCVRVLVFLCRDKDDLRPVYLGGAKTLRPDVVNGNSEEL